MKKILSTLLIMACATTIVYGQEPVLFQGQQDTMVYTAYNKIDKSRLVGAASVITGEQLQASYSSNVQTALSSLSMGFFGTSWNLRGNISPLVVIDGQRNRSMSSITVEEVANVYVLRDVTAKMLFGSEASDGVIVIETKRGNKDKNYFEVSGEAGRQMVTNTPEFMNSYEYATNYNQALVNDGLDVLANGGYSNDELAGYYATCYGQEDANYVKYPNNDMHDIFLNNFQDYTKANIEMGGSAKDVMYFLNLGYEGSENLQKIGKQQKNNRLNVRTNLNYDVNDVLSVYIDAAARWDLVDRSQMSNAAILSAVGSVRPMEYPIFVGEWGDTDQLGIGDNTDMTNLYGQLTRLGYAKEQYVFAQTNAGLDLDFGKWVDGLTGRVGLSYDAFTSVSTGKYTSYATYQLQSDDTLKKIGDDAVAGAEGMYWDGVYRNAGIESQIHYDKVMGDHAISATAVYNMQIKKNKLDASTIAGLQDVKGVTGGLKANYAYQNRYVVELNGTVLGSNKFAKAQRWGLFGSVGAAWNIHNEEFLKNSDVVNTLKLKGSYGHMGSDRDGVFGYRSSETLYQYYGALATGHLGNSTYSPGFIPSQVGNELLTYEVVKEANIGLEATLLDKRLMFEANIYDKQRVGIPVMAVSLYPDYLGSNDIYPIINYNSTGTSGYEVGLSWGDQLGDFKYRVGGMVLYSHSVLDVVDQNPTQYPHQVSQGRDADAIIGYLSDGLYQNQASIDEHGVTSSFATLQPGDIKLLDYVPDGIINSDDQVVIGNSQPRYSYNLNINMSYKGISLFILGQGVADFSQTINGAAMYASGSTAKYSNVLWGAAVVGDDGNIQSAVSDFNGTFAPATYPRLTTIANGHSYRTSQYWLVDGDYFRLKTVKLGYQLPKQFVSKIKLQGAEVYAKCDNLFTISKFKSTCGMDPVSFNAGVTSDPSFLTIAAGVKLLF
ncbi:MAG: SusC/RagA family TonB-linked outer membrane protein [Rikenellaceae bacterium]